MTLQSLKKRPITPPNTRGPKRRNGTRLLAAAIALGGLGLAASAADPGEQMLESLRQRDAAEHWDAAADMLPADSSPAPPAQKRGEPTVTAQAPASVKEKASAIGQWRSAAPETTRTARRVELPTAKTPEIKTAQRDLPPVPDMYDPPPSDPSPEAAEDASPEVGDDDVQDMAPAIRPIARTPEELREIESILPYADYDPNPDPDDPCLNQCPRPDGAPCKDYGDDEFAPRCPEEAPLGTGPFVGRSLPPSVFAWKASNVTHNPLYFQDVALERYGHAYHPLIQPAVSIGRFSGQVLTLPYHMTLDPPCKEMYPLGYYRPGECAPKLLYQPPLNAKAAAVTAGFYTGVGLVLP